MLIVMNWASLVEIVLFSSIFTVNMSAVGVPQLPGKLILLPPTVSLIRWGRPSLDGSLRIFVRT